MNAENIGRGYIKWLTENHSFKDISEDFIELQTPFVDSFGDSISLLIQKVSSTRFRVTDQGYTIWNLEAHGIDVSKSKSRRKQLLHSIAQFEKVEISANKDIYKESNQSMLNQTIHEVTQAIVKIANLALTNRKNSSVIFYDEVSNYFQENKNELFKFTKGMYMPGKNNILHKSDFTFFSTEGTKYTKMYNTINKNTYEIILGIFTDTQDFRNEDEGLFSIIYNGRDDSTNLELIDGLQSHSIEVVNFYNEEQILNSYGIA